MLQRQSPSSIKTQHLCRWVEYMEFLLLTETRTGAPRLLQEISVDLTTVGSLDQDTSTILTITINFQSYHFA